MVNRLKKISVKAMKIKTKFLVNLNKDKKNKWVAKCASAEIQVESNSKEEALAKIKKEFKQFLAYEANDYLSKWEGNHNIVNCPEGKILLPIDIWKCKLNKETCLASAQVNLNQEDEFRAKCSADEKRKEQILNTIKEKKYPGRHHVPGRRKCGLCRGRENYKYHYPWELTYLYQYMDILNDDIRVEFLKSGIDQSAYYSGLCPECFFGVISKLNLTTVGTFEKIDFEIYR